MTTGTTARRSFLSFGLATLAAAVLVVAGWLVAEASESDTSSEQLAGVEVLVPEGWIAGTPTPGQVAVRTDPFDPFARLEIAEISGDPASEAADFLAVAEQRYPYFHVVGETIGADAVWIDYRFVTTDRSGAPVVVAGRTGFVDTAAGLRWMSVEVREAELDEVDEVFTAVEGGAG
ncbi:MAG: hypothetical protein KQH83_12640 [Actinobacteria bacterium]|nr:hypothetical protein [Actinomycetota bacterium]